MPTEKNVAPQPVRRKAIRVRQRLGKYRIQRKLGDGGFAAVYEALDTIEGLRIALKIPHTGLVDKQMLEQFTREVRLSATLNHPNILPLKNAEFIDNQFVVAFPLGDCTLSDRMQRRLSNRVLGEYVEQLLEAAGYAHENGIIHCDIKPENIVLFPDDELMLSDFGISKVAMHTITASGSGTVGYMAPEQAMGKPSLRSDVFSLGLVIYRLITGELPEWPFDWPPPGYARLRNRAHPDFIAILRRALEPNPRNRFRDACQMRDAFRRIRKRAFEKPANPRRMKSKSKTSPRRHWKSVRQKQFQREYRKVLDTHAECDKCGGPVSEQMQSCPWCAKKLKPFPDESKFPQICPRCYRGMKLDWEYCPWCYGSGFEPETDREYSDKRYTARCANPRCDRKQLMPFMRYCPWCRTKVKKKWKIPGCKHHCKKCGWGIVSEFWSNCPWCGTGIPHA